MKLKWIINTTAIALLIVVAFLGLADHDSVMAAQDEGSKIEGYAAGPICSGWQC